MPITPDLSRKLLELKEESGLTFEQIGAETGTSDTNVRRYLKGETKIPDRQLLVSIIRCMGGDPDELLGKKVDPPAAAPFDMAAYDRINNEVEKRLAPIYARHDKELEAVRHANDLALQHQNEWLHKLKDELKEARAAIDDLETEIDDHRRNHRRMMHVVIMLSVFLALFIAAYLLRDIMDPAWGYIRY